MSTYTIYIGRHIVARINTTLEAATEKWKHIADEICDAGTVSLYDGPRSLENLCCQQVIENKRAKKTAGESRWHGTNKAQRSKAAKKAAKARWAKRPNVQAHAQP